MFLEQLEEPLEVEPRHRHNGAASADGAAHDHHHAVDVVERQNADQDLLVGQLLDQVGLAQVRDQVSVGQHDPFRQPGRAARIGQGDHVFVRVDVDVWWLAAPRRQRAERRGPLRLSEDEDLFDLRAGRRRGRFVQKLRNRDQEPCFGVEQLPFQLVGCVEGVDRRVGAAGGGNTEERDGVLRHVRAVDGEDVALAEPSRR